MDAEDAVTARGYFTSGAALGGRGSKKLEQGKRSPVISGACTLTKIRIRSRGAGHDAART